MAINSRKLTQAHTGAIGFKGCKNSGRIRALSGLKGWVIPFALIHKSNSDYVNCGPHSLTVLIR